MKEIAAVIVGILIGIVSLLLAPPVDAGEIVRSAAAVREFKRTNICPSTKTYSQKCPGYVVDHIDPLCNGGADTPANMQYQTVEAGKQKDKLERLICRQKRACK